MILNHTIATYVKNGDRVLDLGCGEGDLLDYLNKNNVIYSYGIDIKEENIVQCIQKGISVFQSDINHGLTEFPDNSFDLVILSQTLQQIKDPILLLNEMCRVGKQVIVSFPNFTHLSSRLKLLMGYIPKSKHLPYEWYNTPNIRVISIKSFQNFCKKYQFNIIEKKLFIGQSTVYNWLPFLALSCSKYGFFVINKNKMV